MHLSWLNFWPNQGQVEQGLPVITHPTRTNHLKQTLECLKGNLSSMIKFKSYHVLVFFWWKMQGLLKLVQLKKKIELSVTVTAYSPPCLRAICFSLWSKRKYKFIDIFENLSKNFQYQNFLNRSQTRLEICKFSDSSVLN